MKKKNIFKKFTIIYFSIIAILCGVFIYYVVDSLILYENSDLEKYIANLVVDIEKDAKRGKITNYVDLSNSSVSKYEDTNISLKEAYANIFKTSNITYELVKNENKEEPVYDIYADNKLLFQINLKHNSDIHRMGLLTFPNWEIKEVKLPNDRGLYYYDVYVLDGYDVKVNGMLLSKEMGISSELDKDLEELGCFTNLPKVVKYEINNLTTKAEIKVYDNNKEVEQTIEENEIFAYELYKTDDIKTLQSELIREIDVLEIAKMWSKFLTDDLAGSYHGYSTIKNYLIEDTHLWDMAYNWAHNVDITFVSNHTLVGFENERISNCVLYSENAFSCDVYLEKNMRLKSGRAKKDIMNDKFDFVYYNNSWKVASMKAINDSTVEE